MAEYAAWMFIHDTRIRRKLKKVGAISEDTAKPIEELDLSEPEKRRLQQLAFIGKIKKTSDGRYYLPCEDEK
jgi:hypothetical protein